MANGNKSGSNKVQKAREQHNAKQRKLVNVKDGKYALIRVRKPVYKALVKRKRAGKLASLGAVVAELAGVELK